MSAKTSSNARVSRLAAVLLHFAGATEPVTVRTLANATGWDMEVASRSLSNAKQFGYVSISKKVGFAKDEHALTAAGRDKLASFQRGGGIDARTKSLGERALELIEKALPGLNSGDLADQLQTTAKAVEEALGLHVLSKRLVSCAVKNAMGDFIHYRVSAGLAMPDSANTHWKKTTVTPLPAPKPAPVFPPKAERIEPVDGCDIDAVHRTAKTIEMEAATPPAPPAPPAPRPLFVDDKVHEPFHCCIDSLGRLRFEVNGEELRFSIAETRATLAYLQHIDIRGLLAAPLLASPAGAA